MLFLLGTGVGKSLFMCHMPAACIEQGKNVLYVTLEMSEERILKELMPTCSMCQSKT